MASNLAKLALVGCLLVVCINLSASAKLREEEEVFATEGKPLEPESTKQLLTQLEGNIEQVSWPRRDFVRKLLEVGQVSKDNCNADAFKLIKSLNAFSSARGYLHLEAYLRHYEEAKFEVCDKLLTGSLARLVEHDVSDEDKEKLAAFKERVLANLGAKNLNEAAPADLNKAIIAALTEKFGAGEEPDDDFFEQLILGPCSRIREALSQPAARVYSFISQPLFEARANELAKEWTSNEEFCHILLHKHYNPETKTCPECVE